MNRNEFDDFKNDMKKSAKVLTLFFIVMFVIWIIIGSFKAGQVQSEIIAEHEQKWKELTESDTGTLIDDYTYVVESDMVSVNCIKDSHNTYYKIYDVWFDNGSTLSYSEIRLNEMEIHKSKLPQSYMKVKTTYKKDDYNMTINSEDLKIFYLNEHDIKEVTNNTE